MAAIKILSAETASRVAAGEVVTRPLNVVKELVENAVDAGSRAVIIELLNGGKRRISVSDDGPGMSREDLLLCVESHATSKLSSLDDFNTLKSFGFRGEALHSIAAVSRLQIESRRKNTDHGYRLEVYGGRQQEIQPSAIARGTRVVVKDLFFNIPARLKFLKSDNYEKDLIMELLQSFIVVHPAVSFRLLHNDRELLFSSGKGDEREILSAVFRNGAEHFIRLPESNHAILGFSVQGFLSPPFPGRESKGDFRIFVNSRIVRYPVLHKTVRHVYEEICGTRSFSGILFIKVPPRLVDVNIHPQKTEIRLDNELVICEFIQNEVKKALLSSDLITAADLKLNQSAATLPLIKDEAECSSLKEINEAGAAGKTEHSSLNGKRGNGVAEKPDIENYDHGSEDDFIADMEPPSGFFLSEPTPLSKISASVGASVIKDSAVSLPHVPVTVSQPATSEYSAAVTLPLQKPSVLLKPESEPVSSSNPGRADDNITPVEKTEKKTLENYRIIGQFANSFIVIEQKDRLLLVDQHVAQETVLFTRIYRGLQNPATGFATQNLLKPLPLSLSAFYSAILSEHEQMLNRVGFSFVKEESGYFLKGTPPMLGVGFDEAAFTDILARLADLPCGNALEKRHREMAAVMACKGSIKAGRRLNQVECEELLKQLSATENPFFCPHGRPVIISFDLGDILQRFGRNRSARIFGETGQS